MSKITRRKFIKETGRYATGLAGISLFSGIPGMSGLSSAPAFASTLNKKIMIIGMDGLDPNLVDRFMAEGLMPTFKEYKARNGVQFGKIQTTNPPQSPVAWSSFISGTNPGGHGIFDFVHRDPKSFTPYMSTSRSFDAKRKISVGGYDIPLGAGTVELMRKGPAFWDILADHGISSSIFQIPANFPSADEKVRAVSGMGTPDLLGTYGTFTYFTDAEVPNANKINGGRVVTLNLKDHAATTELTGPKNPFHSDGSDAKIEMTIQRDPFEAVLRIVIDGHELILKQGEWSEWIPLKFELLPMISAVAGMVRLYVKEVSPQIKLYCSPINVDPMEPSLPICTPYDYSKEVSQAVGRFYTQGFPADTKALSAHIFSDEEYLIQAHSVLDESMRNFAFELDRFKEGLFFFYFSSIDQNTHMLWRTMDPAHPQYDPKASAVVKNGVRSFYKRMDDALKLALTKVDSSTTLLILSDHGFSPFYREFNLGSWLVDEGFTVLKDPSDRDEQEPYKNVDWSKSVAYALGLNGIYINLEGRERHGWVGPKQAAEVRSSIIAKLAQVKDPQTKQPVLVKAYDGNEIYSGPFMALAPDVVVGYNRGYRVSDEGVLGKFPLDLVTIRKDPWAADHCVDPSVVPGILISNQPWQKASPALWDMAPTILDLYGIPVAKEMEGKSIFAA